MNKKEIGLLGLIHQEANEAYWSTRNDCGSDVKEACQDCQYYRACSRNKEINQLFAELTKTPTNTGEEEQTRDEQRLVDDIVGILRPLCYQTGGGYCESYLGLERIAKRIIAEAEITYRLGIEENSIKVKRIFREIQGHFDKTGYPVSSYLWLIGFQKREGIE